LQRRHAVADLLEAGLESSGTPFDVIAGFLAGAEKRLVGHDQRGRKIGRRRVARDARGIGG
jgi:hypothetical protein